MLLPYDLSCPDVSCVNRNAVVLVMHVMSEVCEVRKTSPKAIFVHLSSSCMMHGFLMCSILILHMQMHPVCITATEVEDEALVKEDRVPEVEVEVSVTEGTSISEPVTEATEKLAVEELNIDQVSAEAEPAPDKVVTETVVESVETEIPESEQVTEAVVRPAAPVEDKEGEAEVEALAEEDAPEEVPAEPVTVAEVQHLCVYFFPRIQSDIMIFFYLMYYCIIMCCLHAACCFNWCGYCGHI